MSYEAEAARRYRAYAEELRIIAEVDHLEETRGMLMRVALDYETIARNMEQLDARHALHRGA